MGASQETGEHLQAYEVWYQNDRSARKCAAECGISEDSVGRWAAKFGWHQRADERDAETARVVAARAVKQRARQLEKLSGAADTLLDRAVEFLQSRELTDERAAIAAIKMASDLVRGHDGTPQWVIGIMRESDEQLLEGTAKLRARIAATSGEPSDGS